jgi:SAM-dependent methyltransferase
MLRTPLHDLVSSPRAKRLLGRVDAATRACAAAMSEGGPRAVRRLVVDAVYWRFHPRVRRWRAELEAQGAIDEAFDRRFGVDTAGEVALGDVGIAGVDVERGHGVYRSVWASAFREAMASLPIEHARFTFVDYGSGKGKALMLAAEFPFEEIVGVEFARPLHDVAARNLATFAMQTQPGRKLHSECADATLFVPPERPLVCFFFNPFDAATMDAVLANLVASARRTPRDVYVVRCNMRGMTEHRDDRLDAHGLRLVTEGERHQAFRMTLQPIGGVSH